MSSTQEKRPQEAEFVDWCCRYGVSLEEIVYSGSALRKGNTVDDFCDDDVEYLRKTYDDLYERVIKPIVDSAKREGYKEGYILGGIDVLTKQETARTVQMAKDTEQSEESI